MPELRTEQATVYSDMHTTVKVEGPNVTVRLARMGALPMREVSFKPHTAWAIALALYKAADMAWENANGIQHDKAIR